MYSANIREVTLKRFFQWIVDAVSKYAIKLLGKDRQLWPAGLRNIDQSIIRLCAEGGWRSSVVTMDKSRAELNAVKGTWADVIARLCFWHIKNAILKWEGAVAGTASATDAGEARPQDSMVPKKVGKALIAPLVAVFRAETAEEFNRDKVALLATGIEEIVEKVAADRTVAARQQLSAAVIRYVSRNWLDSEVWMPCFADHDLGDVNSTNYLEAAFKMIDRVILQGRLHMSVAILLLRRLWAYIDRQEEEPRLSKANRESMAAGALVWEQGAVRRVEGNIYEVLRSDRSLARVDISADPEPATDSESSSSDEESGSSSDEDAPATVTARFSAALALQASVAYTQRGSSAGLAVKWPTASGQSTQTNFQLGKRLASQPLPTEPPTKRADPVKGPEAPPELLAPKFDWADAVGAILPTIIGLADASRLKDPLSDVFQTAINKFPDTLAVIYKWWYLGVPLASRPKSFCFGTCLPIEQCEPLEPVETRRLWQQSACYCPRTTTTKSTSSRTAAGR